jgi:hypothetical protein
VIRTVTRPGQFKDLLTGAMHTGEIRLDAHDVRVLQAL